MKIGIVSDTHNNVDNTKVAVKTLRERAIKHLIHCGDITTPEIIYLFSGLRVTFVLGNMDRDWVALGEAANQIGADRPRQGREIEIDGKTIGITHGSDTSRLHQMMMSGKYDYVCHGHTHERRNEYRTAYGVRLINPGALGGSKPQTRSICVLRIKVNVFRRLKTWRRSKTAS
jgi:putative phosphoesterase